MTSKILDNTRDIANKLPQKSAKVSIETNKVPQKSDKAIETNEAVTETDTSVLILLQ